MADQLLNYHRVGDGSPLVLVHGIAASWQCWKPIIPALATAHDVITPDLPGFGGSVALGVERPSLEHFAQSILELLDELGIDRFHVAGNSLGGAVALELLKSGRVLSYTGISPAGQTHGRYLEFTKLLLRGSYYGSRALRPIAPWLVKLRPLRALLLGQMVGRPQRLTADYSLDLMQGCAVGSGFEATLAHAIPGDRGLDIPPYDGPAQILWGTRDLVLPLSAAARYGEKWDGCEIIPMKGLGHVPMQDDPKLVADLTLKLTRATDAARHASAAAS
jgi:pimeloyl-ACP methyl ester carboxylesterase